MLLAHSAEESLVLLKLLQRLPHDLLLFSNDPLLASILLVCYNTLDLWVLELLLAILESHLVPELLDQLADKHLVLGINLGGWKAKEASDLGCTLGDEALGDDDISEARKSLVPCVDKNDREGVEIGANDATAYGLALSLTVAAVKVALSTLPQKKACALALQDTLVHGESLGIIPPSDAERASSVLLSECSAVELRRHAEAVYSLRFTEVLYHEALVGTRDGVRDVDLAE